MEDFTNLWTAGDRNLQEVPFGYQELETIYKHAPIGLALLDTSYRFLRINDKLAEINGFSVEDHIGKTIHELLPSLASQVEAIFEQIMQSKEPILHIEITGETNRFQREQRTWIESWYPIKDNEGQIVAFSAFVHEVTDQRTAELQLKVSEQRFRFLVQEGSDLFTIIDEQGIFSFVSDNVRNILGYSPEEMLGKSAFSFIHPDDLELTGKHHEHVVNSTATTTRSVQHRFLHKNGDWIWLDAMGANHLNNKNIRGIVIVSRNIHERVQLESRLKEASISKQREITEAVIKAEEKSRSELGMELHDNVNQVLATVKLYTQISAASELPDRKLLQKAAEYTQSCIDEIRSISKRLSAPQQKHISLHDAIKELVSSITVSEGLTIQTKIDDVKHVPEDLYLTIYRIVQEALNNMLKYSHATESAIELVLRGNLLHLTINDNGVGFDVTAKRSGTGLSNMRTRAQHMNASHFHIFSAPGNGCSIQITFPIERM